MGAREGAEVLAERRIFGEPAVPQEPAVGVDPLKVGEEEAGARVIPEQLRGRRQLAGQHDVIRIAEGDEVASGCRDADIARP